MTANMTLAILMTLAVRATLLLGVGFGVAWMLRRGPASYRHLAWVVIMAGLLAVPMLEWMPEWVAMGPSITVAVALPSVLPGAPRPAAVGRIWIVWLWMVGVALLAARTAWAQVVLWRIWRSASPLTARIRKSDRITTPFSFGLLRPAVLVPAEWEAWSAERRRVVLAHEWAHVERRDPSFRLMGQMACALYWFHPLVWLAERRMRAEQERACDDQVLRQGEVPSEYAGHLLDMAASMQVGGLLGPAMSASDLPARVGAILAVGVPRGAVGRWTAWAAALAVVAVVLPLPAMRPQAASGLLSGTVRDRNGAAVPSAEVHLFQPSTLRKQFALADAVGEFRFEQLDPDAYELIILVRGFGVRSMGATVAAGKETRLPVFLDPGDLQERVVVTATRPAEAPAVPATAPQRLRVGGNVHAARLLQAAQPEYPSAAIEAGADGPVVLKAVVRMDGTLGGIRVVSAPHPALAEAAERAIQQYRYEPTRLNGQPIETVTVVTVNFRLTP